MLEDSNQPDIHGARSFAYGLIARTFRCPTSAVLLELRNPAPWRAWKKLLRVYPKVMEPLAKLSQAITAPILLEHLEHEYVNLFGHTVRGSCPLYELEYGQSEIIQQASMLADIAGFYAAFGLMPTQVHERQDYFSVECEFMGVLAAHEANALRTIDQPALETVRQAQIAFLEDHLGHWSPACMCKIKKAASDGFYRAAADFAAAFIESECEFLNVNIGPALLNLREVDSTADANIECGVDENCPGSRDNEFVQIRLDESLRRRG